MRLLVAFLAVLGLWMLLFWQAAWSVLLVGAAFSALIVGGLSERFPPGLVKVLDPRRWFFASVYLVYFLWCCMKANVDVALRVIHPDVPIRPGIVKVRSTLRTEMARTFLANSITLTPGTLSIDLDGQDLYVHWINIKTTDPGERYREVIGHFEPWLRRIFE